MVYVALLRGINVGGNNPVKMTQLRAAFETAGMSRVRTYINSGNVIFETERPRMGLADTIEQAVLERCGSAISILLVDAATLASIAAAVPADWDEAEDRCDVFFLWPEIDKAGIVAQLAVDPAVDELIYVPGAILRRTARADLTRSRLTRIVGTPIYRQMTARGVRTVRKLAALAE
jgi:uncharacterized protein (DUF1697 family)